VSSRISNCSALAHGVDYLRRSSPVARTHFPDYRQLQAASLGFNVTLIREDGKEGDVFTLIGPNATMSLARTGSTGFIAAAEWRNSRAADPDRQMEYALQTNVVSFALPLKIRANMRSCNRCCNKKGHRILIIGEYLDQLQQIAEGTDYLL